MITFSSSLFRNIASCKALGYQMMRTASSSKSQIFVKNSERLRNPKVSPEHKEAMLSGLANYAGDTSFNKMSTADPDSVRVQDVYKQMDSSLEGFFYQRKYNLKNFNFLLQILAEQRKAGEALKALEKMKQMGIVPNQVTYLQLLTAVSKSKDATMAEKVFLEAKNNPEIGVSIQMYNSLILCYTRRHEPEEAMKILREMKNEGLQPDIVCYTTVINAFKNAKNLKKCWELFDLALFEEGLLPDENLLGLMIEICAGTHDAEKAKRYLTDLLEMNFKQTCLPYNAVIKALGSRKDYAAEGINFYHQMVNKHILPDADTYVALFKATSMVGDVKTAYNALIQMKQQNIPLSVYMYNGLLRTYAGACAVPYCSEEIKELYVQDAWKLFKQLQTTQGLPMNVNLLNSLLYVHTKANVKEKIEGLVLPLYEKYGIKRDTFTYQHLMEMYLQQRDMDTIDRLYGVMKSEGVEPSFYCMNYYLEMAMRLQNTNKIVEVLEDFIKAKKEPKPYLLKKLGKADDMPDTVFVLLQEFENKYGFAADSVRRHRAPDKYLNM